MPIDGKLIVDGSEVDISVILRDIMLGQKKGEPIPVMLSSCQLNEYHRQCRQNDTPSCTDCSYGHNEIEFTFYR